MRISTKYRKTLETEIKVTVNIDGEGTSTIKTGIGFFDHMLTLFSKHGLFNIDLEARGDLDIDSHHTVEDVGILLGQAFKEALGEKYGIVRYANIYTPMDESLSLVALDIGGRPYLSFDSEFSRETIGNFDTELVEEFFKSFVNNSGITLHIKMISNGNTHHMIESIFKGFGRALDSATRIDERIQGGNVYKGSDIK